MPAAISRRWFAGPRRPPPDAAFLGHPTACRPAGGRSAHFHGAGPRIAKAKADCDVYDVAI